MSDLVTHGPNESEVMILARILGDEEGKLPGEMALYLLNLKISARDQARMHDLATRNQSNQLTLKEKEEMSGYSKATTLLSVLKSRARRTLGLMLDERPSP